MNKGHIENYLASCFKKLAVPLASPTDADWERLRNLVQMDFPSEFILFMNLCCLYDVDWQFLNVSATTENGNDSIETVYKLEMEGGGWDPAYIPFHEVGNGDYYCLNRVEGLISPVYYYDHEQRNYKVSRSCFTSWLETLKDDYPPCR